MILFFSEQQKIFIFIPCVHFEGLYNTIMSWHRKDFLASPLWGESTSHWWISITKGQLCGTLRFCVLSVGRNCWTNNGVTSDLRCYGGHTVILSKNHAQVLHFLSYDWLLVKSPSRIWCQPVPNHKTQHSMNNIQNIQDGLDVETGPGYVESIYIYIYIYMRKTSCCFPQAYESYTQDCLQKFATLGWLMNLYEKPMHLTGIFCTQEFQFLIYWSNHSHETIDRSLHKYFRNLYVTPMPYAGVFCTQEFQYLIHYKHLLLVCFQPKMCKV